MIQKGCGKKWLWHNLRHYPPFAWREWGKVQKSRSGQCLGRDCEWMPPECQMCYHLSQLTQCTHSVLHHFQIELGLLSQYSYMLEPGFDSWQGKSLLWYLDWFWDPPILIYNGFFSKGQEADHSLHLVSRWRMVQLYLHFPTCPHGTVANLLGPGTFTLPYRYWKTS
jgi:hypothetical protein